MAPTKQPPPKGGGGGFDLQRKYGPLPLWGWIAVAVVGFILWRRYTAGSAASAAGTPVTTSTSGVPTETLSGPGGSYTGPFGGAPGGITGVQPGPNQPAPAPAGAGPTPGQGGPSPGNSLPPVNASQYPSTVTLTQLEQNPGAYTEIGQYINGQYVGTNVTGGVPVYAANPQYGGLYQGFNPSQLPSGTGVYIPTQFTGYEGAQSSGGGGLLPFTKKVA